MLTSRLLSRPEKWDLHRAGVLDPEFPKEQEPEAQTKRAHVRQQREAEKKPEFSTKVDSKGTMSRSQMQREVEAADLAKKREKTIRRLANHLKNRPPKEKIVEKNIIPSFVNSVTGTEYYVFHSNDFHSPGKPLGIKSPNRFHKSDFEQCKAAIEVKIHKRMES